jgi:hypothetical protein
MSHNGTFTPPPPLHKGRALILGATMITLVGILGFVLIDHVHAAAPSAQPPTLAGLIGPAIPVTSSPQQRAMEQQKMALAHELQLVVHGKEAWATYIAHERAFLRRYAGIAAYNHTVSAIQRFHLAPQCINTVSASAVAQPQCTPAGVAFLSVAQEPEYYWYWCGPATGAVILNADGFPNGPLGEHLINDSVNSDDYANQKALTHYLGWNGTNWSQPDPSNPNVTYSPMQSMLNQWITGGYYNVVNGSGVGGGFSTANLEGYVVGDVSTGWAVAGGMYLYPGDQHLPGYYDIEMGHWIPLVGYAGYGATIYYDDPIYKSPDPNLQWPDVPGPTASVPASQMATVLNSRGVIW